jgi:hypothetical protein
MTKHERLSELEKNEMASILLLGCDRTTARNFLGLAAIALRAELGRDEDFARRLLRAEATAEIHHMRNVHHAAKDEKNWRASVWWLERRAPERFGRRDGQGMTQSQFREAVEELAKVMVQEVSSCGDRTRLVERLRQVAAVPQAQTKAGPILFAHDDDSQDHVHEFMD